MGMTGVTFMALPLREALPRIFWLFQMHWDEIGDPPGKLDIDYENYLAAERAGALRVYVVQPDGLDRAVGYAMFRVVPMQRHKGVLAAWQDLLFVHPDARVGSLGLDFVRYCDTMLKDDGVAIVHHSVRGRDFSVLLRRLGYKPLEQVFFKEL